MGNSISADLVRYGIIGTASIAVNSHIPAASESKNSEILSISSRNEATASKVAAKYSIPKWWGSYEELLKDPDLDAVINPLPNSMHCEWTVKAAEAGKHILCEKPLALTTDEARRMIHAANANNVLLVEAFTHRWLSPLRRIRELIQTDTIGQVTSLYSSLTFSVEQPKDNIRFSPELRGGSLLDAGSYAVSACRFVLGEDPIRATGVRYDSGKYGVDTTFNGLLEFPRGTVAHISSSFQEPWRCELIAIGSKGRIETPQMLDESSTVIINIGDSEQIETKRTSNRFRIQLDKFSECVLSGKCPEFPAEDGLRNTAALEALLLASEEGSVVDIESCR